MNSSEYPKHTVSILKKELDHVHMNVADLFETFFGGVVGPEPAQAVFNKCMEWNNPLHSKVNGWQKWPEGAIEGADSAKERTSW